MLAIRKNIFLDTSHKSVSVLEAEIWEKVKNNEFLIWRPSWITTSIFLRKNIELWPYKLCGKSSDYMHFTDKDM